MPPTPFFTAAPRVPPEQNQCGFECCCCYLLMVVIGGFILTFALEQESHLNKPAAYAIGFISVAVAAAGLCVLRQYFQGAEDQVQTSATRVTYKSSTVVPEDEIRSATVAMV